MFSKQSTAIYLLWFFGFMAQFPEHEQLLEHESLFFTHPHRLLHFPSLQTQLFLLHGLEAPTTCACASPIVHLVCVAESNVPKMI